MFTLPHLHCSAIHQEELPRWRELPRQRRAGRREQQEQPDRCFLTFFYIFWQLLQMIFRLCKRTRERERELTRSRAILEVSRELSCESRSWLLYQALVDSEPKSSAGVRAVLVWALRLSCLASLELRPLVKSSQEQEYNTNSLEYK